MSNEPNIYEDLGERLALYCRRYSIPVEYIFDILTDQKVVPMLRGKGMEFNVYLALKQSLSSQEWAVEKLNLSAQTGTPDQDIGVTHRRTGERLIVESKSAVRGSMTMGSRSRNHPIPHFKVKCHRSRSNIKLATVGNDRYKVDSFDVLVPTPRMHCSPETLSAKNWKCSPTPFFCHSFKRCMAWAKKN